MLRQKAAFCGPFMLTAPAGAARVDLAGTTVIPTLIDTHVHSGLQRGLTYAVENYTRDTIMDELNRLLYFGVGAVQSLGVDLETVMDEIRADQEADKRLSMRIISVDSRD